MHMAPRVAAWVAWAVWTCNTPQQGIRSKESGLRSALFFGVRPGRARLLEVKVLHSRHGQMLAEGNCLWMHWIHWFSCRSSSSFTIRPKILWNRKFPQPWRL